MVFLEIYEILTKYLNFWVWGSMVLIILNLIRFYSKAMQGPPVRGVFSSYLSGPDPPDYAPAP
jgi:hypothetical protein